MPSGRVANLERLTSAPSGLWTDLRSAFVAAGYTDGVLDVAEDIAPAQVEQARAPLVRWGLLRLERADADLAALFVYGATLARARVEAALGAALVGGLLEAGVLTTAPEDTSATAAAPGGRGLAAGVRIVPFDGVWILSDELWRDGDPVMGPSMTTDVLRRALPPLEGKSLLDVGCGAGSLAVWAAARGARAVGCDISPRAIALAGVNARLNGVACELVTGDLTQPVAGRTFDLVVSQPPFLIQPPDVEAVTFLHGGASGVELTLRLLSELEAVLAPEGRAILMFDAGVEKTPVAQRIVEAMRPRGPVGVVAAVAGYLAPDAVALLTAAVSSRHLDPRFAAQATRYRAHLAARGIDRVAHVVADVRRLPAGAGRGSFAATTSWNRLAGLAAQHLERSWRAVELLGAGPAALLDAPLRLADGGRLRVDEPVGGGEPAPATYTLAFGGGVIQDQSLDETSAAVLRALEAGGSVAAACEALGEPGQAAELHPLVTNFARRLLLHGVLYPG